MQTNLFIIAWFKINEQCTLILLDNKLFQAFEMKQFGSFKDKNILSRYSNEFDRCSNKGIHDNGKPQMQTQFITYDSQQCKYENYSSCILIIQQTKNTFTCACNPMHIVHFKTLTQV